MRPRSVTGVLQFAGLSAIVATVCDANHVATGTLAYPRPVLFGQAWWVLPGFCLGFFLMGASYLVAGRRLGATSSMERSTAPGNVAALVEAMTSFVLVYLMSGFGNESPAALSFVFYGAFALRLAFTYERAWLLAVAVTLAIGGMAAEGTMGAAGIVAYRHVDVFHVPLWLGGVYMHGAFALREGMRVFVYRRPTAR
jgi:hypothetical protein